MNEREQLMEIFSNAEIDFFIEYTLDGEMLVVINRYEGLRFRMIFDGEGNLLDIRNDRG